MALSDYEVKDTEYVILEDASGVAIIGDDGKPIIVEIYSPGTKQYAKAEARRNAITIERLRKKGRIEVSEEQEALEAANFLADCSKSVSENMKSWFPGKEGRELLVAMYSYRPIGFIKDQISTVLRDWANFTKSSTSN